MRRRVTTTALTAVLPLLGVLVVGSPPASAAVTGPTIAIDPTAGVHPISRDIYGMNFADEALARELKLPVRRWGGNATTRYNYALDETNRGSGTGTSRTCPATPTPRGCPTARRPTSSSSRTAAPPRRPS